MSKLQKLKLELTKLKLNIKAGKEPNTNAHKKIKLQIAQLLTDNKNEKKA